eukprot:scaffold547325_cov24-Prasinocladus_malaysianus.AAC.2
MPASETLTARSPLDICMVRVSELALLSSEGRQVHSHYYPHDAWRGCHICLQDKLMESISMQSLMSNRAKTVGTLYYLIMPRQLSIHTSSHQSAK